jgi:ABC-type transport system involved in cytochrome c biogenesis permease component
MLDDFLVFLIAVIVFSKFVFGGKYNYWATLAGGILMIILGLLLLLKPDLLFWG